MACKFFWIMTHPTQYTLELYKKLGVNHSTVVRHIQRENIKKKKSREIGCKKIVRVKRWTVSHH